MAKDYSKTSYFASRPDIVQIFNDLDAYHNFCRLEARRFDPADLYNYNSRLFKAFISSIPSSAKPRKPYLGKKPWSPSNPKPANYKPTQRE
jgi:hypothetical protein